MNLSLYNIEQEYLNIAAELQENGGELTPELESQLEINKDQLQVKSAGYAYVIKETEAEIKTIDSEIERLNSLKKSRSNSIYRLKTSIKNAMELYGVDKIQSNLITLTLAKLPPSVVIENESLIPSEFKEQRTTNVILKKEISEELKSGGIVSGAYLEAGNKSLRIK